MFEAQELQNPIYMNSEDKLCVLGLFKRGC